MKTARSGHTGRGTGLLKANLREAAVNLYVARQRSLLALIGIVIGISSVIALVSVGKIVQSEAIRQFEELGTDILTVRKTSVRQTTKRPLDAAVALGLANIPAIEAVVPYSKWFSELIYGGKRIGSIEAITTTEAFVDLYRARVAEGRFISPLDAIQTHCVLGAAVAGALRQGAKTSLIGESVLYGETFLTVIGVLEPSPLSNNDMAFDSALIVAPEAAKRYFRVNEMIYMTARISKGTHHLDAVRQTERYFRRFSEKLGIHVETAQALIEQMQKQSQMFTLLLGAVGSISLIVGGIGIMNVMLVAVSERRLEIGIRRALGARQSDIRSQFLIEAIILSLCGGVIGVALGIGTAYAICEVAGWTFELSTTAVAMGSIVATGVGLFFGFFPAHQAARLDTIAVLRGS